MFHPRHALVSRLAVLCVAVLALARVATANVLVNGSFESGPVPPGGELVLTLGAGDITGWTVGGQGIEYISDVYWVAAAGSRSIALNADDMGSISQTFATVPGARYDVAFSISGEPFTTPVVKHVQVSAAGQSTEVTFDSGTAWHWDMQWSRRNWSFVANAASTTIAFASLDAGDRSPTIDDVDVQQTTAGVPPSPLSLALEAPYPNPAQGPTILAFTLPEAGDTQLHVLDAQGRMVSDLIHGPREAGRHRLRWDAVGEYGEPLHAGMYFVALRHAGRTLTRRIALTR